MIPTISCILPVYNGERYLQKSINSVIAQTFTDWELIIIDDGSTDHTAEILDAQTDTRIRVYHNERNRKLPATLNRGFMMARGKYWTWTSHDNKYLRIAFGAYMNAIEQSNADVVYSDCRIINACGERYAHRPADKIEKLPYSNVVHASFLFKPAVWRTLGGYDESLFRSEDWDFWIRAYLTGMKFHVIPFELYEYRVHDGMLCHDWWDCQIAYARTAAKHFGVARAVKQFGCAALQEVL
jgi:glycosyltransferase involved in cell wall biosynthesis